MYQPQKTGRRTVLKTLGAGAIGIALTGTASAQRSDELSRQLNEVRHASKKYRDVSVARADGYGVLPFTVSPYTPEMGFHFVNPQLMAADESASVDLSAPPILVYYTTGNYDVGPGSIHDPDDDDKLRLGAVEFGHVGDEGPPGTPMDLFADEDASRTLKVTEAEGWEWVPGPDITALHVWVHRNNPAGVFHPTNPTLD